MAHYVFDAYGTLFDVHSAASRHRDLVGESWAQMSQIWRTKHLEYTWIHAQTRRHVPFWTLAGRSLDFAAASVGGISPEARTALLAAYRTLSAYPEVPDVLRRLKQQGHSTAILTNGDPDMIAERWPLRGLAAGSTR
jgi:2-haloacid dehalogenase